MRLISLLIAICILSFLLVSYSPIDPVQTYIGADLTRVGPEQTENIVEYWGLNESKTKQLLNWGKAILEGNLGTSYIYRSSVADIIAERFLSSILLMAIAWILSGILGFFLGVLGGMNEGSLLDRFIKTYCFILASTPGFWLGILLLMVFSVWLGWFPIGLGTPIGLSAEHVTFLDKLYHAFLPAITLSIVGVANVTLHTREKLIEVLETEYIRFGRAKGESGCTLLWRHGLRNISLPAISLHFASFAELFGGAVLAEQVFSYPGLGQTIVQAGLGGDVPLLLGIVLFSALFVFIGNIIAEILYRIVDPRIREGEV
ncbi:ABC transporter permease [Pseudogracilibacillus sp. SE30717A]|uniref:ABC transporter permease n=1 Tax=Pseudogracilibacillus sp. SE30717A TaxID=3098293 RepID=UPI00300DFE10